MSATVSTFSRGGSTTTIEGEITRELINATDGAGLHFDGTSGTIDIATVPDVGTKNSFEFIVQASEWPTSGEHYIVDFGPYNVGRFIIANNAGDFKIRFNTAWSDAFSGFKLDDLKPHHLVVTANDLVATVYVDGNSIGTHTFSGASQIESCTDAKIGSHNAGSGEFFNGNIFRARLWNKTLKQGVYSENGVDVTYNEIRDTYESASLDFADQWGDATNKITGAVDKNWGTPQPDTGVDATDRATFDAAYEWAQHFTTDISVASNVLQFSTSLTNSGVYINGGLVDGKRYRFTIGTGTISGQTYKVYVNASGYVAVGTLAASTTNVIEFIAPTGGNGYLYIFAGSTTAGTIQLNAASVSTELVASGCVADYDLSYANPTQSAIVQNRSGSGDATAVGGVVQITAIEQLNSKSARIGTTAATPADGDLLVSGNVSAGPATPTAQLFASASADNAQLKLATYSAGSNYSLLYFNKSDTDSVNTAGVTDSADVLGRIIFAGYGSSAGHGSPSLGADIKITQTGTAGANHVPSKMVFSTSDASSTVERLSISSAGAVIIGTGVAAATLGGGSSAGAGATAKDLTLSAWSVASGTNEYGGDLFLNAGVGTGNASTKPGLVRIKAGTENATSTTSGTLLEVGTFSATGLAVTGAVTATTVTATGALVKVTGTNPALGLYSTASSPQLNFGNAAETNHWSIYETVPVDGTQGSLNFYDVVSTATRLSISSAGLATFSAGIAVTTGGIKFPQPQSASADANTLDDYEEGTFGGNAANDILQPATSGSITCAGYGFMSYTKVGRMVTIQGQVVVSAVTSPVGETRLNLPFPCRANSTNLDARAGSGIHCAALDFPTGCTSPTIWIGESESFANLQAVGSGVAWSYITIASAAAQTIAISFSYQTT
jgi:hypothetical protein